MRSGRAGVALAGAMALAGCGQGAGAPNGDILANSLTPRDAPAPAPAPAPPRAADGWGGRWTGPEGLFLDIAPGPALGRYVLTIKADLDSRGDNYVGTAEGATIRFSRGGAEQVIRHGTGAQTGFKWLAGKKNCLIVVPGKEGYCRD